MIEYFRSSLPDHRIFDHKFRQISRIRLKNWKIFEKKFETCFNWWRHRCAASIIKSGFHCIRQVFSILVTLITMSIAWYSTHGWMFEWLWQFCIWNPLEVSPKWVKLFRHKSANRIPMPCICNLYSCHKNELSSVWSLQVREMSCV